MAKSANSQTQIIGIVLLVVGVGLAFWGYQESQGVASQVSSVVTGSAGDKVMLKYLGGAVCIAIGAFLTFRK